MQYSRGMPALTGTVAGDPVAQSVGRGRQAGGAAGRSPSSGTVDLLGIDFYPSSPLPLSWQMAGVPHHQRAAPFLFGVIHPEKGIQGSGMGLLASQGPSPLRGARTSRNHSLFSCCFQPAAQKALS